MTIKYINAAAYTLMILVNYLSVSVPLGGLKPDEVSEMFPVLFTPAGYVFSIWGLIYALLAGFIIYSFVGKNLQRVNRIGYLFGVSCVLNAAWLVAWHWLYLPLSLLIMVLLLAVMIAISLRLSGVADRPSPAEKWLVHLPFSLYLGWISVATIANVSVFLYDAGWDGWGLDPVTWTVILMATAVALGALTVHLRGDFAYPLVIIWALSGIAVRHSQLSTLAVAAWGGALLLALFMGWQWAVKKQTSRVPSA